LCDGRRKLLHRFSGTGSCKTILAAYDAMPACDSNYGVVLPWWDRLFGTCLAEPVAGHENTGIGLLEFQHPRHQAMPWMLAAPFLEKDGTTDSAKTGQPLLTQRPGDQLKQVSRSNNCLQEKNGDPGRR
jgi:hypothetical protein